MTPEVGGDGRSDVFERLGIPTIINAKGTATRLSGALLAPEVAEAMRTDAGYVTSGEAAGLLLGTAAALTGLAPARMNRLRDVTGMSNQVAVACSQRNFYDHAVRTVSVEEKEFSFSERCQ